MKNKISFEELLKTFYKRGKMLLCNHSSYSFIRNIYGDEIREKGYMRSMWRCNHCNMILYKRFLNEK